MKVIIHFLKLSFFAVLFLGLQGCINNASEKGDRTKKPNIVFILVDDLGLHDLSVTGSTYYETPNVDRLANGSMIFTQGYAASRVCSPSRASILTGKFTARHGITDWIGAPSGENWRKLNRYDKLLPAEYVHELPKSDISLAEAFKEAGYKTFYAGKWHLGGPGSYPEDHGFDINKGGYEKGSPIGGYFAPWDNPKLPNKELGENLSLRLAKETADFIRDHKDTTFLAFLSFYAVHGTIETTQRKWQKYRNKAMDLGIADHGYEMERVLPIRQVQDNPVYGGLVETMDDAVGIVLEALSDAGIDDNTIVVFTSDNGGVASGDNYSTSNLPLRGGKGYQWEGGVREPYFIKVPWLKNTGDTTHFPVTGTDFYPTLLDFAGIQLLPEQHIDGISLKPILEGKEMDTVRPLYWHYPHYGNQGGNPSSVIREKQWKLIHYWEDGSEELYDLGLDIGEQRNLIEEQPKIAQALSEKLMSWLSSVGANLPHKDVEYDPEKAKKHQEGIINHRLPALELERLELLSEDFLPNQDWWGSQKAINQ
jgi:arylsulfatase A-like enzyme